MWRSIDVEENRNSDHVAFNRRDAIGQKQVPRDSATACAAVCRT